MKTLASLILSALLLFGCVANPVTGSREFVLVEEPQEISIGNEIFIEMQKHEGGLYTKNDNVNAYVARVGQKLASLSDRPNLPYEFVVLDNPVPNAWTLPGGKIAVNSGLLKELESEAELAAVLSHEIVHAAGRHGAQTLERALVLEAAAEAGCQAAGDAAPPRDLVSLGTSLIMFKYSRNKEFEADCYGMKYMAKAGYDLQAAVTLQEKFLALADKKDPHWLEGLFATHPPTKERLKANRETAREYPPGGFIGSEEYKLIKSSI